MDIGIGLPSNVSETYGEYVLDWAVEAERVGFASVAASERIRHSGFDPLVTLAAAAAVTRRVRLLGTLLIDPPRPAAIFARQVASVDQLSGGRLVLGMAARRPVEHQSGSAPAADGGTAGLDQQLRELRAVRAEPAQDRLAPAPARTDGPVLLLGGFGESVAQRVARHAHGWLGSGGSVSEVAGMVSAVRRSWAAKGREGSPSFTAARLFSFGPRGEAEADRYVERYYGNDALAAKLRTTVMTEPKDLPGMLGGLSDAGCDEVVFLPCSTRISQLEHLAEHTLGADFGHSGPDA